MALLLALCLAAGASAQLDAGDATGREEVDTVLTPRATDTLAWAQIHGAEYGKAGVPPGSATPVDAEFYTVAFRNDTHGFAGGAQCKVAPPAGMTGDALTEYLDGDCGGSGREPIIYEYEKTPTEESWRPVLPPTGDGFVGSIAFLPDGRALAVGGTGDYPEREQRPSTPENDAAGDARAWIYARGFWSELGEAQMPDGMRGLTAVAFSQRAADCANANSECGLAGGYRQLWAWKDGEFAEGWDSAAAADRSPDATGVIDDPESFRFRVRQIAFVEDAAPGPNATKAIAVTSGCCDATAATNTPAAIVFNGEQMFAKEYALPATVPGPDPSPRHDIPDSFYSVVLTKSRNNSDWLSVVASHGGPPVTTEVGDRPSRVYGGTIGVPTPGGGFGSVNPGQFQTRELPQQPISTMRLRAGAGTFDDSNAGYHMLDWAVGSLASGEGIAYYADGEDGRLSQSALSFINVLECSGQGWAALDTAHPENAPAAPLTCQPYDAEGYAEQLRAKYVFRLPSYGLNAIAFTDTTESVAWAVGDRGAIVRFGGVGTSSGGGTEPPAAKVGGASLARFSGSDVYDAFRPLPTDGATAPVPSLASNGTTEAERPRFVAGGAPNPTIPLSVKYPPEDVSSVAMSLDGSEGWAVGSDPFLTGVKRFPADAAPSVYHYDGTRWSRCDITGIAGVLPADPACSGLESLSDNGKTRDHATLHQVVRVPVENDDDPGNDEEFEVFALGAQWDPPDPDPARPIGTTPVVARYSGGRWGIDDDAQRAFAGNINKPTSIAFTSPTDGWIATDETSNSLWHWDGEAWIACGGNQGANRPACGDTRALLPLTGSGATVAGAGRRVYFSASRDASGGESAVAQKVPAILYKDPGEDWTAADGGYDPACGEQASGCAPVPAEQTLAQQGEIIELAISPDHAQGWALGYFGENDLQRQSVDPFATENVTDAVGDAYYLLRLSGGVWSPWRVDDAASDYLREQVIANQMRPVIDPVSGAAAIYSYSRQGGAPGVLLFDPQRGESGRWRVLQTPYRQTAGTDSDLTAQTRALVPDGGGGFWLAAAHRESSAAERPATHFWRYTTQVPNQVFEDAPHPIRERITGSAAAADGGFWVTTNSGFVYRYDRLTGWDRLKIPGWDRGRIQTRTSEANDIAVTPDGDGLVVGKNGRIAEVSELGVKLDPAVGKSCEAGPPCSTGRDLRAVDMAPDGSALAGGDASALLYQPPGGEFRRISFGGSDKASITGISMPTSDQAWLINDRGQVFAGQRVSADEWDFDVENLAPDGTLLSYDERTAVLPLHGIEIDADGEGYAVGARGLVLERRGDAGGWQRLKTRFMDTLRSVALPPSGRDGGALIGGDMGLILTLEDGELRVAREADMFNSVNFGPGSSAAAQVVGVAMIPGVDEGEVEAWAVQQSASGPGAVLHYSSDPDDVLLKPGGRIEPLPDTPAPRPGEISFVAFGRSECHSRFPRCDEGGSTNLFHEAVQERLVDEVIAKSKEPGGPSFAVFTGDVGRAAGQETSPGTADIANTFLDKSFAHRRWIEHVADPLFDSGVPVFGAVGMNDLDRNAVCSGGSQCDVDTRSSGGKSVTWGWRQALAKMPPPWGAPTEDSEPAANEKYAFAPVAGSELEREDPVVGQLGDQARTHYAIDLARGKNKVARLIFIDNSMGTTAESDANQNPIEPGGQLRWLEDVLERDREPGQQTIVVMNRPTYSYQVTDATTWANDGSVVEQTLLRHGVKMVVSGRLGWNGRYWTTAPGLHAPCPGGEYIHDDLAPEPGATPCEDQTQDATDRVGQAIEQLADAMQGLGPPPPPSGGDIPPVAGTDVPTEDVENLVSDAGLQGLIPTVVAASAGGQFGPNGTDGGEAKNGWWHGYTIVRMDESGDPRQTIVEQRPLFDWVSITGPSHVLKPRQRMTLIGEGREPVGVDVAPRYDRVDSYAITHRYDLVLADKENPSLPARDANGDYTAISRMDPTCETIGCINDKTGVVQAGNGRHERLYAVAILSVGDQAASWPIVFEPAKSFKPVASVSVVPPAPATTAPQLPATVVLNQGPAPATPPPPPPGLPPINVPPLNLPPPPVPPQLPIPTATPTPTPPPPPAPPPPPGNAGALPLSLEAPLTPVSIVPTVIPPSPPPVNPAPPSGSGARKEARQRQAATAKSEEGGGDQGAGEGQSAGDNGAAQMARREPTRPAPSYGESSRDDRRYSFTALSHSDQPSAWSRGALYGGMTLATALALALGWGIARPTPRRRHPARPAPQTVRNVGRRPDRQ